MKEITIEMEVRTPVSVILTVKVPDEFDPEEGHECDLVSAKLSPLAGVSHSIFESFEENDFAYLDELIVAKLKAQATGEGDSDG